MSILLLVIIITYQAILSLQDMKEARKYKSQEITERVRVKFYKECIFYGWLSTIVIFIFTALTSISFYDIGFRGISIRSVSWLVILTFIISGILLLTLIYQTVMFMINENYKNQLKAQIAKEEEGNNHYNVVTSKLLIPRTKKEKKWFLFVSLTAGICEEIVWRGCLLFLLQDIFPALSMLTAGIISCILFGLIHCYQGIHGIIKTAIISVIFVLLYFVTDSIFPGIFLHFLFDYSSAFLLKEESPTI